MADRRGGVKIVLIIGTLLFVFWFVLIFGSIVSARNNCQQLTGIVKSIYFSPRSWGHEEFWTGKVIIKETGETSFYTVSEPVEIGDTVYNTDCDSNPPVFKETKSDFNSPRE